MEIILVLHNIRSVYNVGAILRTAEGAGVRRVIFSGYTPVPLPASKALPHIAEKETAAIHKTALGAERMLKLEYAEDVVLKLLELKKAGFPALGLENNISGGNVFDITADPPLPERAALVLGEEVAGIPDDVRAVIDEFLTIPMRGRKESFNVSVAAGIALYELLLRRR